MIIRVPNHFLTVPLKCHSLVRERWTRSNEDSLEIERVHARKKGSKLDLPSERPCRTRIDASEWFPAGPGTSPALPSSPRLVSCSSPLKPGREGDVSAKEEATESSLRHDQVNRCAKRWENEASRGSRVFSRAEVHEMRHESVIDWIFWQSQEI